MPVTAEGPPLLLKIQLKLAIGFHTILLHSIFPYVFQLHPSMRAKNPRTANSNKINNKASNINNKSKNKYCENIYLSKFTSFHKVDCKNRAIQW